MRRLEKWTGQTATKKPACITLSVAQSEKEDTRRYGLEDTVILRERQEKSVHFRNPVGYQLHYGSVTLTTS
jgi:hypothetical protein